MCPDKLPEYRIVKNTSPPAFCRFVSSKGLDLALMLLLDLPFHLNAVERLLVPHGSITSFGEWIRGLR